MSATEDPNKLPPGWRGPDVEIRDAGSTTEKLVLTATSPPLGADHPGRPFDVHVGWLSEGQELPGPWAFAKALAELCSLARGVERARALDEQIADKIEAELGAAGATQSEIVAELQRRGALLRAQRLAAKPKEDK